ncbi:MAG: oligosaccharide flippase family protein, partial [Thermoanaerobaculia bacterium]
MSGTSRTSRGIGRARNVLSNWGAYVFSALVSFVLSPFIVHSLGDVSYGIWILLGSLVGYLGLLDLGVRGAVTRFIARYHTQKDHDEATRVASSALVIFTVAGLAATLLAIGMAVVIGQIFEIPAELLGTARMVVILGGINIAVSMVSGVYGGVVIGLQRFEYVNAIGVAVGACRAVAIVAALKAGLGLVALAVIQLGMSTIGGLAIYWLSRRLYPELRTSFRDCRLGQLATIFSFSVSVLLLDASGMLILFTDSVVIGAFLPLGMVTFFAIASNLTDNARAPVTGISHTVTPWASALQAGDDRAEVQGMLLASARISTLIVLPIVITFIVRGGTFIGMWMGPEYSRPSGKVLWILSLALSFAVGYQVVVATMIGLSKHKGLVPAFILEAICNIGLSVAWIHPFGIVGVAWGTTVPRLIASLFFAPWYARRVLGIPIRRFWTAVWVRPGVAMIPFAIGSHLLERWWPATNLVLYFAQIAMILPLAALGAWG